LAAANSFHFNHIIAML